MRGGSLVKPYLHLTHHSVIAVMHKLITSDVCTLIDILQLHAALLEEPVLESCDDLVLILSEVGVEVEEIVRAHKLHFGCSQGHRACQVGSTAYCISVIAFEVFPMQLHGVTVIVEACRPAVTLIVLSIFDGGIGLPVPLRRNQDLWTGEDIVSTSNLSGGHEVQSFHGSVFQSSDEVFVVVAVLSVNTLSIHDLEFVP